MHRHNTPRVALRRPGTSRGARTAKQIGSRLLTKVDVRSEIDEILARAAAAIQITVERTQRQIARVANGDIRSLYDEQGRLRQLHELDEDMAAMVA